MSRQPIVTRAAIVSGVGTVVALLALFGVDVPAPISAAVVGVLVIVAPFAVALLARRHTTPISDPQDANGSPLVPAVSAGQEADGGAGANSFSPEADAYTPEHAA
ncbi:hypothetical protein OG792_32880 [Micromonospora sp. NBC_01699]|uniref:hypothetical protein n=1 Tax=Micromonospora sp. NBC_01699 TaxID=2975984 RepID=UPI002E2D908B|nr:hypothetical protein [Micromonospora sp. NBC_01699]